MKVLFKVELKNLVERHGVEKMFVLFPTREDYIETAKNVLAELCGGDENCFYAVMDRFVKDSLVRLDMVEFCEE